MKLRKISLTSICLLLVLAACKKDDESYTTIPDRDRQEVYDEDLIKIEEFLATHFYNYDEFDFDNPYSEANDNFQIVFDTIEGDNADKIPLIDQVDFKIAYSYADDIEYKLYYLKVREGNGKVLHGTDEAYLNYQGLNMANLEQFDGTVNPTLLNLTTVSTAITGVIDGFRQGLTEFKTASNMTANTGPNGEPDNTYTYHGHGIGAIFIPSGLGYFSSPLTTVPAYSSLIFNVRLYNLNHTDFDLDNIPSYMEDLSGDGDPYTDDTDGDLVADFMDNDDDGDGTLTRDEIDYGEYTISVGDPDPEFAENEYEVSREQLDNTITISTIILTDTDGDGTPDYLDSSIN
ncbi:hypothetical protein GZ212_12370 [Mangrovimonas sp. CR14]|uniref:FKBP-type peptidyl-prolyl cis-trans isomerase n=1 Tax=Mangrovimonas sp. CR14 TaxID=2706120 RepID=UPI00141E25EB|nr:hypothetical protein [Mangrovimonas sp. CR14]NIK92949.1 hypothetical protein [Mangrovimonas sp. CR14]